jgi:hypothetical protein
MPTSRPAPRILLAKPDAAEAYRRLNLQRKGVERHLYTVDGNLYCNVAMPFGEAPSAAAFSRCALAFGAYLFLLAPAGASGASGARRPI